MNVARSSNIAHKEVREGTTYQSSVCMEPLSDLQVIEIPAPTIVRPVETISDDVYQRATCCVFDLETTSLCADCEIIQMSAVNIDGEHSFNKYVLPIGDISFGAG